MNLLNQLEEQEKKEKEVLANIQILRIRERAKEINFLKKRIAILMEETNALLDEIAATDDTRLTNMDGDGNINPPKMSEEEKKKIIDKINSQEDVIEPKVSEEEKQTILERVKETVRLDKLRIKRRGYRHKGLTFYF